MKHINWRKWNNVLHRDIGYLAVGLTIIFAVSGIAVNHIQDWNPNYSIVRENFTLQPPLNLTREAQIPYVLEELGIAGKPKSSFRPSPGKLQLFLDNETIEWDWRSGRGSRERVSERSVLFDFNYLHLNHAKKLWTWFSDLYALALLFLAVSGLFVLKGKNGLAGRGKWLLMLGLLLPGLFLVYYRYLP